MRHVDMALLLDKSCVVREARGAGNMWGAAVSSAWVCDPIRISVRVGSDMRQRDVCKKRERKGERSTARGERR